MKPLVSVIVPVYNTQFYLKKCLESILRQTYQNLEIILVDDASTDKSGQICEMYRRKDSRVRIIHHRVSRGAAASRNDGIDNANGTYICFVDSDDWINKVYIETLASALIRTGAECVVASITDVNRVFDKHNKVGNCLISAGGVRKFLTFLVTQKCFLHGARCS